MNSCGVYRPGTTKGKKEIKNGQLHCEDFNLIRNISFYVRQRRDKFITISNIKFCLKEMTLIVCLSSWKLTIDQFVFYDSWYH